MQLFSIMRFLPEKARRRIGFVVGGVVFLVFTLFTGFVISTEVS